MNVEPGSGLSLRELKRFERAARGRTGRNRGRIPAPGARIAETGPARAARLRKLARGEDA